MLEIFDCIKSAGRGVGSKIQCCIFCGDEHMLGINEKRSSKLSQSN
jgi:hypothetical protein